MLVRRSVFACGGGGWREALDPLLMKKRFSEDSGHLSQSPDEISESSADDSKPSEGSQDF